jgi:enoyl-CoA hydratase/carnithine racemase
MHLIQLELHPPLAIVRLNDPAKRNALSLAMFDALDEAIAKLRADDSVRVVLLSGAGRHFCAGFDLAAAVEDPSLMGRYIQRLSGVIRALRRLDAVVVMAVDGAAVAGGCALVTAADFVVAGRSATFGYPVHAIGVSPAVTLPTLEQKLGCGTTRALTMSGELIDGKAAHAIGLVTHLADHDETAFEAALSLADSLAQKPPHAMRVTRQWLNELDGSLDDERFDRPAIDSIDLTRGEEGVRMLREFWQKRRTD